MLKTKLLALSMLLLPLSSFAMNEREAAACRPTQKMEDGVAEMAKVNAGYKISSKDAQTIVAYTFVLANTSKNCAEFEDRLMQVMSKMAAGLPVTIDMK